MAGKKSAVLKEAIDYARSISNGSPLTDAKIFAKVKQRYSRIGLTKDSWRKVCKRAPEQEPDGLRLSQRNVQARINSHEQGKRHPAATPIGYQRRITFSNGVQVVFDYNENFTWTDDLEPGATAPAILRMYELFDAGRSYVYIARDANARRLRGRHGANIDPSSVYEILTNETYKGTLAPGKASRGKYHRVTEYAGPNGLAGLTPIHDALPAIVPTELWNRVNAAIAVRPKKPRSKPDPKKFPLADVLRCRHCGPMQGFIDRDSRQGDKRHHMCRTNYGAEKPHGNGGVSITVRARPIESFLETILDTRIRTDAETSRNLVTKRIDRIELTPRKVPYDNGNSAATLIRGEVFLRNGQKIEIIEISEMVIHADKRWAAAAEFVIAEFKKTGRPVRLVTISRHMKCKLGNGAARLMAIPLAAGLIEQIKHKGYTPTGVTER